MSYSNRHMHVGTRARGFTLIEVLVSLVILSIGLLGMAKLMLVSAHSNDSAYLRSQATMLAYEMLDTMRANSAQAAATPSAYATALGAVPADPGPCGLGGCANVALYDVYQWKLRLNATSGLVPAGALPNGQGSVATTSVGAQTNITITVQWDDSVAGSVFGEAAAPQQIVLETLL